MNCFTLSDTVGKYPLDTLFPFKKHHMLEVFKLLILLSHSEKFVCLNKTESKVIQKEEAEPLKG